MCAPLKEKDGNGKTERKGEKAETNRQREPKGRQGMRDKEI
jgi:hypothetical protein